MFMMGQPILTPLFRTRHALFVRSALELTTLGHDGPGWHAAITELPPHVQPATHVNRNLEQSAQHWRSHLVQMDARDEEDAAVQEHYVASKNVFLSFTSDAEPEGPSAGTRSRVRARVPTMMGRPVRRRVQ